MQINSIYPHIQVNRKQFLCNSKLSNAGSTYPFHPYGDIHYDPNHQMNHLAVPGTSSIPDATSVQSASLMGSLTDMSPTPCTSLNLEDATQQPAPTTPQTQLPAQSSPQTMSTTSLTSPEQPVPTQQPHPPPALIHPMNGPWTDSLAMVGTAR